MSLALRIPDADAQAYLSDRSFHGSFNAKWLTPEEVARRFIPIPAFQRLVHSSNSLLLGPRGSGKTTLLKMLTHSAMRTWRLEREKVDDQRSFEYPQYEAVYIPADARWLYELNAIVRGRHLEAQEAENLQRVMVNASTMDALLDVFQSLAGSSRAAELSTCEMLIAQWGLSDCLPTFRSLRGVVLRLGNQVRGLVNSSSENAITDWMSALPHQLVGHALDVPVTTCRLFAALHPNLMRFKQWALCYDELEIAPGWLRDEVLESLRSIGQPVLIKATWSPLLPSGLKTAPDRWDDYRAIRLWNSHVDDARLFCENLTQDFLSVQFPDAQVAPEEFLGHSVFAGDEGPLDESTYSEGSDFYEAMKDLAREDETFKALLVTRDIDPRNPIAPNAYVNDTFFRKIKPIVLLRDVFNHPTGRRRSRKVVTIYAGKQAVYGVSEGNPRWLLALLTELYDRWRARQTFNENGTPRVRNGVQARTLNSASRKFEALLAASPVGDGDDSERQLLKPFLEKIGFSLQAQMLSGAFPVDPIGSFHVDQAAAKQYREVICKALDLGALVYVGSSDDDVPSQIEGARFRLTFMLAPIFKLPFRNYRDIGLSEIIARADPSQYSLF